MSHLFVNQLADGESIDDIYLLSDKQLRANRNADLYLLAQLRDKTGQISGLLWNVSEDAVAHIQSGDYVRVRGKVQLYQGNLQVILTHIAQVQPTQVDPDDYIESTNQDVEKLLDRLREILLAIDDLNLRTLMECFLVDDEIVGGLSRAPAGVKLHHAYHGGLLEHIVNVLETALRIGDLYPKVDLNLLLAGIFLHDIGKLRELGYDQNFVYTDEGQLLGHLLLGVEMLNEKIPQVEQATGESFPQETALRLKHMLLSHHGTYEFGSPKLPMTPEAIALHHLDNLDAKINEFTNLIESDPNTASTWTPYQVNMQRKLYKGSGPTE
ncbi:3'-5' exoribonuclease YhaM [Maioricimonas rarisocia]|uniref:3'-5' exoribonuclease YhaM n=1 Tax=Maioricimonas rarisocia TaxID=2528026 RepID=A0A517Z354_9PLAN|nr:HD domain-containing protein [Maioricimonas rarisocia]QDU36888.1 3'-5' exoribonuclease YhaM [Maioricimonas rarisocia]